MSSKPPITRDLTASWRRHRARKRPGPVAVSQPLQSQQHPPGSQYPGSEALLGDEAAPHGRGDRSLPPEWVDYADKAQEEIKEIRTQLVKLAKAQQRRLLNVMNDAPDREVEATSSNISTLVRCCEQSIHQIRSAGKGPRGTGEDALLDDEFRQNMQRNLASQLQQLSKQCRETQKEYLAEMKKRKGLPQDLEVGGRAAAGSSAFAGSGGMQVMEQQLNELDEMEVHAAQRSGEIAQIASSVMELNRIFKDLAALVIDQGTVMDRIDCNTEKIYKKSDEAKGQIQKAVTRKKDDDTRAWKCLLVWGGMDAVLLLVLLIKYQLKYGLLNVLIFFVVMGLLFTACYYGLLSYQPRLLAEGPEMLEKMLPEGWSPQALWKRIRPGPVNAAKAAAAGSGWQ